MDYINTRKTNSKKPELVEAEGAVSSDSLVVGPKDGALAASSVREMEISDACLFSRSVETQVNDGVGSQAERVPGYENWKPEDYQKLVDEFGSKRLREMPKKILLMGLVAKGNLDLIKCFAENDPASIIAGRGVQKATWLHVAAYTGQLEVIKYLLNFGGIDPNARDSNGSSPIQEAFNQGHKEIVDLMLKDQRISVNSRSELRKYSLWTIPALPLKALSFIGDVFVTAMEEVFGVELRKTHLENKMDLVYDLSQLGKRDAGYYGWRVFKMFAQGWKDFAAHDFKPGFWQDNKDALVEHFNKEVLPMWEQGGIKAKDAVTKIKSGAPCWIPSGNSGHYENITVCGNWVAIANRGEGTTDDPSKVGTIQKSGKKYELTKSGMYFYYIPDIEKNFGKDFVGKLLSASRSDDTLIRQIRSWGKDQKQFYIPSSHQKRGNCTYSNGKLDLKAQLIFFVAKQKGWKLEDLNEKQWDEVTKLVDEVYQDFRMFNAVRTLQRYETHAGKDEVAQAARGHIRRFLEEKNYGDGEGHFGVIELKNKDNHDVRIMDSLSRSSLYT